MNDTLPAWVVIVNWQRPDDTIECVRSIYASDSVDTQVLVVDNGSKDASIERITKALPQVTLLSLPENLGFTGGYNEGIQHALKSGAEQVLVLNNDSTVELGAIQALFDAPWDVSVPKILFYSKPDRIWAAGARWRSFPPSVAMLGYGLWGQGELDGPRWNQPCELEYATGCALMVKRCVFETVGGFDHEYGSYMEDYDFCYRVRSAGFRIGYIPTARIRHKVSQTIGRTSPKWWELMGRNTVLFYRKDKRFPVWTLWSFLIWMMPREIIKGNGLYLPYFWTGIRKGFEFLNPKAG